MKNYGLILLLTLIYLPAYPQCDPFPDPDKHIFLKESGLLPGMVFPELNLPNPIGYRTNHYQPIRETYWEWDETKDTLRLDSRYLNTYNPNGLLTGSLFQKAENGQWRDEANLIQVYNPKQQLITQQFESWISHSWIPTYRNIFFYNDDHLLVEKTLQAWHDEKWLNVSRKLIEKNYNLNLTIETTQYWDSDEWVNQNQLTSYFNISGDIQSRLNLKWEGGKWIFEIRETFLYNDNGLVSEVNTELWKSDQWEEKGIYYYSYDPNQNNISITFYRANPLELEEDFRWGYEYDAHNNLIKDTFSSGRNDQWNHYIQNIHRYDEDENKISLMTQLWTGTWQDREFITYDYPEIKASSLIEGSDLALFPNPASDEIQLVLPDKTECPCRIFLSGIDGKISMFLSPPGAGHLTLPLTFLSPGWYNLRLLSQNLNVSHSFIKH